MKTLSVIGCGKLARTLGCLWSQQGLFRLGDLLNRSEESGRQAADFLGAGRVVSSFADLQPADIFLIATVDDAIVSCCNDLAASGILRPGNVVFHCSGLAPSTLLESAVREGAAVASVHPVKSFADPAKAVETFAGTFCALEGDPGALNLLQSAFEAIGGRCFSIDPAQKSLYHAGMVVISNYLTTLLETGGQIFERVGLPRTEAFKVMEPIVKGVVENVFTLGTTQSLTGPFSRGDVETIRHHLVALAKEDPLLDETYRQLGRATLVLSRQQGTASSTQLRQLAQTLESHTP